ncbi:hypothetical protein [Streptomyces sp. NPDC059452]|uniref:hypothetical protein n=1 Tax=Streptomyces sp. NPDC059452 TaxID=3346835 RepID=UPI0036B78BCB
MIDPALSWRQALVAADAVVGDFGAVTYYAAALGTPPVGEPEVEHRAHVQGHGGGAGSRRAGELGTAWPSGGGPGRLTLQPLHYPLAVPARGW